MIDLEGVGLEDVRPDVGAYGLYEFKLLLKPGDIFCYSALLRITASRGQRWEMIIGDTVDQRVEASLAARPLENADFYCAGRYGKDRFDAGYMPLEQAEKIIRRCVRLWRMAQQDA